MPARIPPISNSEAAALLQDSEAVFWDFDGVLLDSMSIRDDGFRHVLREFDPLLVKEIVTWHQQNGGLSRYVKFRRFQKEMLHLPEDEPRIMAWAREFSDFNTARLLDPALLISATVEVVKHLFQRQVPMHIVSGSDGTELRHLCAVLGLTPYFHSIEGSPTPKVDLIQAIMTTRGYAGNCCWLVGDAINDQLAAHAHDIRFMAFGEGSHAGVCEALWQSA